MPPRPTAPASRALLLIAAATLLGASGCQHGLKNGGADAAYLEDAPAPSPDTRPLLPLVVGSRWSTTDTPTGPPRPTPTITNEIRVSGALRVGDRTGVAVDTMDTTTPAHPQLLRRDVYQPRPDGVDLLALAKAKPPAMLFHPPLPLLRYPATVGAQQSWYGTVSLGDHTLCPATALNRISARETITTPAGTFHTLRLDSTILVTRQGVSDHYSLVQWLAPGVGIVRRRFKNQGLLLSEDLVSYRPQS